MMAIKALVWVLTGMLAASLCSGLVQDCDNCDKVLNKFCCARKDAFWKSKAGKKKICCDFRNAEPVDCLKKRDICMPSPAHPDYKPCCKGLSCETDPQGTFTYRCIEKEKGGNQCQGRWGPSPYDSCNRCKCENGCFTAACTLVLCPPPEKTKTLGQQCSIEPNNCVGDLVCKKLDFLPYNCGNGVGVCEPAGNCGFVCIPGLPPVCGSDGKTYSDICALKNAQCHDPSLTLVHEGECKKGLPDLVIFVEADPGAYQLSGAVIGTNAEIEISQGDVLAFKLNAKGHPFWIKTQQGTGQNNAVSSGISGVGQGKTSGVLIWDTTQLNVITRRTYYYQCQYHADMFGTITVSAKREPANCAKLGRICKKGATTGKRKCCPGLDCKGRRPTRCVKAGGGGKPCLPKNTPCVKVSACCSKRCKKVGTGKKCA